MAFDFFSDVFDALSEFGNEVKDFHKSMEEVRVGIKGSFAEFGKDLKNTTREFERDLAWEIDPDLGELVEKKQGVEDTIENVIKSPLNLTLVGRKKEHFELADHLFVRRVVYTHHAIYIGDGRVIHYSPLYGDYLDPVVHVAGLEEFSEGDTIRCLERDESPLIYSREEAVCRAWSRVGENGYNLFGNNCEQLVRWCRCGREN